MSENETPLGEQIDGGNEVEELETYYQYENADIIEGDLSDLETEEEDEDEDE